MGLKKAKQIGTEVFGTALMTPIVWTGLLLETDYFREELGLSADDCEAGSVYDAIRYTPKVIQHARREIQKLNGTHAETESAPTQEQITRWKELAAKEDPKGIGVVRKILNQKNK